MRMHQDHFFGGLMCSQQQSSQHPLLGLTFPTSCIVAHLANFEMCLSGGPHYNLEIGKRGYGIGESLYAT